MRTLDKVQWPSVFAGLQGMTWANFPHEISAGITLAALIIPLNIGYAEVAGLPPVFGLYAGIIPLAIFALFTSSRHVVGSPDAPISAILGAILIGCAPIGDPLRVQYALAIAVMCGLLFFVFWFFRLAFLANFLSRAVLAGFITGLGIEVLTNQVRRILGAVHAGGSGLEAIAEQLHGAIATSVDTTGYLVELIALLASIPHANLYSVAIGLGAFVIVRFMKAYAPKAPAALIALILTTVVVAWFGLDQKGVKVLGTIPSGLPSLTIPNVPLSDYLGLLPGAMAVVGITLCEALLLVRSYSRKHNYKADGNQVLFAYGMASLASGFSGSLVSGPSASRTAAMDAAGSWTQLSSLVAAVTVALVMVFFTDELAYLPTAALAGVVASAVLKLIEVAELRELWQMRRSEFWIAAVCMLSVLVFGPLRAVVVAFLLATIDLLRRASRPRTGWYGKLPTAVILSLRKQTTPRILRESAFIGSAHHSISPTPLFLRKRWRNWSIRPPHPVKWFVLDAQAMNDIDTTGAETLHQVLQWLKGRGVSVSVSRANPSTTALLAHYHLLELIGENRM